MIRISAIKLKADHNKEDLLRAVSAALHVKPSEILELKIVKKSLDARKKNNIVWNYIADARLKDETRVLKALKSNKNISPAQEKTYVLPPAGSSFLTERPCVVGSGPAGLFCAYFLAKKGFKPLLIEQGEPVEERKKTAEKFWAENTLDPLSNIQFGEGGAGTFSDGKLNTGVNDKNGRNRVVLETFVSNGAPEDILYLNKPHIGTDVLITVVRSMRNRILSWGGEVFFNTRFIDFNTDKEGRLSSIILEKDGISREQPCRDLVLACGHSARDTFYMLRRKGVFITAKAFAVGLRAEHSQEKINQAMYGKDYRALYGNCLPPADYKLTYQAKDGRGVYSFCMCPGGYVVNASSEPGLLCVNGMSYSRRDGANANSAIVAAVSPEDTGADLDPMKGIEFQRDLERKAFEAGGGRIPAQRLGDFVDKVPSRDLNGITVSTKGSIFPSDLNLILPGSICADIKEAFSSFGRKIKGFDDPDTMLYGTESRTSCPIRILRNEAFESNIKGIFPCGEGAGYSGGIVSSAMDGIKVFEEIYSRYQAF